ncbi:MAG UNVERIFIED_CONTAM: hypothetical protein LVR18_09880 [Planctomycetaceae bacterium]
MLRGRFRPLKPLRTELLADSLDLHNEVSESASSIADCENSVSSKSKACHSCSRASISSCCCLLDFTTCHRCQPQSQPVRLAAESGQRWCRGNMHTHSFWSDGDDFPEAIAKWYRDRGYQFLVFTDHNTLLQKERWVNLDKRKAAYESLAAAWPAEWIDTR